MTSPARSRLAWIGLSLSLLLAAAACANPLATVPTSTPYPTYTPYPPPPTAPPARWDVAVLASEGTLEFGDFYIPEGSTTRLIHLTITYTYNGPGSAEFSPETLTLMNDSGTGFQGWAKPPVLYRADGQTNILDFANDSVIHNLASGTTRTEDFVWEWPTEYDQFRLFFPETEAIDVSIP
jgi:hypothetical protein